jgi:hypothetical protein
VDFVLDAVTHPCCHPLPCSSPVRRLFLVKDGCSLIVKEEDGEEDAAAAAALLLLLLPCGIFSISCSSPLRSDDEREEEAECKKVSRSSGGLLLLHERPEMETEMTQ